MEFVNLLRPVPLHRYVSQDLIRVRLFFGKHEIVSSTQSNVGRSAQLIRITGRCDCGAPRPLGLRCLSLVHALSGSTRGDGQHRALRARLCDAGRDRCKGCRRRTERRGLVLHSPTHSKRKGPASCNTVVAETGPVPCVEFARYGRGMKSSTTSVQNGVGTRKSFVHSFSGTPSISWL